MSRLLIGPIVALYLENIIWIASTYTAYHGQLHLIAFRPYC